MPVCMLSCSCRYSHAVSVLGPGLPEVCWFMSEFIGGYKQEDTPRPGRKTDRQSVGM
jgi:hypothetical protein